MTLVDVTGSSFDVCANKNVGQDQDQGTDGLKSFFSHQTGHVEMNMPRTYFLSNLVVSLSFLNKMTDFKIINHFILSSVPRLSKPILPYFLQPHLARHYQEENFVKAWE